MNKYTLKIFSLIIFAGLGINTGCSSFDDAVDEEKSSAFQKGRSYLKVGKKFGSFG